MVVKTLNTSVNSGSSREKTTRGGYAEIHQNLGVDTHDLSDFMVNTILGRETPAEVSVAESAVIDAESTYEDERRASLGQLATTQALVGMSKLSDRRVRKQQKLNERLEKMAVKEDDSRFTRIKKKLGRGGLITVAVAGTAVGAAALWQGTRYAQEIGLLMAVDPIAPVNTDPGNINLMPAREDFHTVVIAGGAGQGNAIDSGVVGELQAKGYEDGYNVEGVNYPAQIGPVVGQESMEASTNAGSIDMYAKAHDDLAAGRTVQLIGYSEGSAVALQTANRLLAEGVDPSQLNVTIIGSPYAQGGLLYGDNAFANMASPITDMMGIPSGIPVPPGTHIVYYDTDFWANSGHQVPTSMLRQLIELGAGGHAIPDPNDPSYTFTDSDGVIHTVYTHRNDPILQMMMDQGIMITDTESANRALNALFPLDGSKPNVSLALNELANTLDNQGDPASAFVADFIRNLPPEYAALGQAGMDSFNLISTGFAKIGSGDILGGMADLQAGFQSFTDAMHIVFPNQGQGQGSQSYGQIQQLFGSNVSGFMQQATGMDFSPQINSLMGEFMGGATANGGSGTANFQTSLSSFMDTVQAQVPQFNGQAAAHAAGDISTQLPGGVSAEVSAQVSGQASVTTPTPSEVANQFRGIVEPETSNPTVPVTQPLRDAVTNVLNPQVSAPAQVTELAPAPVSIPDVTPPSAPAPTYEAPAPVAPVHIDTPVAEPVAPAPPPVTYEAPAPAPAPEPAPAAPSLPNVFGNLFHPNTAPSAPAPGFEAPATAPEPVAPAISIPAPSPKLSTHVDTVLGSTTDLSGGL